MAEDHEPSIGIVCEPLIGSGCRGEIGKGRNRQKEKNIFLLRLFYFSIAAATVAGRRGCRSGAETGAEVVVFMAK